MKTLKSVIVALVILVACGTAKANDVPETNLTKTHAINTYLDAMTRGKTDGLNQVVDQSAKFNILRGKSILSYTKKEMTDYLKNEKDVEQVCTTSTEIVENNADMAVVRVDMKFENFTRSNYVTVANTGSGWKITNVYSVFK